MKRRGSRRRIKQGGIAVSIIIAFLIILLYGPWFPLFEFRELVVVGNQHVSDEEIQYLTGFAIGDNILRLPLGRVRDDILSLPWIRSVSVRRLLPNKVKIQIVEREEVAAIEVSAGNLMAIDVEGYILAARDGRTNRGIVLRGIADEKINPGDSIDPRGVGVLAALWRAGLTTGPFTVVDLTDPYNLLLLGPNGLKVRLGSFRYIDKRVDALSVLLDALNIQHYQSIDLRFRGEAILAPRTRR
ncbi:FtsQ-type POTRA domain-containing protein [Candidatus Acetothermia bacterium]|nr:FtsQ-type POTRA domain-containing protein [Candidatus Acetothermia bacterium]MCI2427703.1 FtsQ-type POTRA domain-containing protein [Candidatus Acetothermia bacterium]MCI2429017.1 FtsQ-type POTRA domain-containing protein [Candidatus Acetothermia bacterium]